MNCCIEREGRLGGFRVRVVKGCSEGGEEGLAEAAGTCCSGSFERRFKTKEEKVSGLKDYLKDLESEVAAVREAKDGQ
ncbi:MAG: hypothetical protein Q8M76_01425 [Spirochaetaceae bacterium]|nr:hypothetical protein [Spirochaetaceae bacterium]